MRDMKMKSYKKFAVIIGLLVMIFFSVIPEQADAAQMPLSISYCKLNSNGKKLTVKAAVKEKNDKTDKYTRPDGYFVSDFNEALGNLFADSTFSSKISDIEDNQDAVNMLMKELKNPPDEYKEAYDAISDLYNAYISLTNCATDPSGSLQTYSSTFNDADTNMLNAYKAMQLYIDD